MNIIARQWDMFSTLVIPADAPQIQRIEMRRAFYAGFEGALKVAWEIGETSVTENDDRHAGSAPGVKSSPTKWPRGKLTTLTEDFRHAQRVRRCPRRGRTLLAFREPAVYVNSSDLFAWGYANMDEVTPEFSRCGAGHPRRAGGQAQRCAARGYGVGAVPGRKRTRRAYYEYLDKTTWPLSNACGKSIGTENGNPVPRP
jgi:hypothetical protein